MKINNIKKQKQDVSTGKQFNNLPVILIPATFSHANQQEQKIIIQSKQSDFIKRIKRTKSIIEAQQNRKQKHLNSSYFMYCPRKKNKYFSPLNKNQNSILSNKKTKDIVGEQRLQTKYFPPVHSSAQISLKQSKRSKDKLPINKPSHLDQITINNNKINSCILSAIKQRNQFQHIKNLTNQLIKASSQRQKISVQNQKLSNQIYNYSAIKLHDRDICQFKDKVKKKFIKSYRYQTQQNQKTRNEGDLDRWQYKKIEDQHYIIQQINF